MLNKSHPLSRYRANGGENKEKCLMHFDPDARIFVLSKFTQDTALRQIFLTNPYLFHSIFSVVVWTNRLHNFDEGIYFSEDCCYENR